MKSKNYLREADSFLSRFFGLSFRSKKNFHPLLFKNCRAVHTCFMRFSLDLVWIDKNFTIIKIDKNIPAFRAKYCFDAFGVVEYLGNTFKGKIGEKINISNKNSDQKLNTKSGQALVETAIMLPVLFLIIFGFFQLGLAFSAKQKLLYVTNYAAQVGALTNDDTKISGAVEEFFDPIKVTVNVTSFANSSQTLISTSSRKYGDTLSVEIAQTVPISVPFFSIPIIPLQTKSSAKVLCTNLTPPYVCQ